MKMLSAIKYIFAFIGAGMLVGAGIYYGSVRSFVAHATRGEGTVAALVPVHSDNSTTYSPIIRFQDINGKAFEFQSPASSSVPRYQRGEAVPILYLQTNPYDARIDSFFSLWGGVTILSGMGGVFVLIGGGGILLQLWRNRTDDYLLHQGVPVEADFQSVALNTAVSINGRNPFRVVTQWLDPTTSQVHLFESHNVWFDPTPYIKQHHITVFMDRKNPRKYYVDLSFLPKLAA